MRSAAGRWWLFILLLSLLLARVPFVLAAGANNLATRVLIRPWQEEARRVGMPRCGQSLTASKAAAYAMRALRWNPGYGRALLNAGRVAWLQGRCPRAQAFWERVLQASPRDQITAFWLFWILGADEGRPPGDLSAWALAQYASGAGRRAETAGQQAEAVKWYELSLDLSANRDAAGHLARLHQEAGRVGQAVAVWRRVVTELPRDNSDHWWALGRANELAEEWEQAAWAFGRGAAVSEEPYEFWLKQGSSFQRLGRLQEAERAYQQALRARRDLPEPYLSLAAVKRSRQQYGEALGWCMKALAIAPNDVGPLHHVGLTYYDQRDYGRARGWFEAAQQVGSDHIWNNRFLALTLYRLGETSRAVALLAQAVALDREEHWEWAVQLGDWQLELGETKKALEAYERALEWAPAGAGVQERVEQMMVGQGQEDDAP